MRSSLMIKTFLVGILYHILFTSKGSIINFKVVTQQELAAQLSPNATIININTQMRTDKPNASPPMQPDRKPPLMISYVFGKEAASLRRFAMWIATAKNAGFDFVIVGDHVPPFDLPPNVKHFQITWDALLDRLYDKVFNGTRINEEQMRASDDPRKVCDYKPLIGVLFDDLLEGYDWWGFVDNDGLLGNLAKLFPPFVLDQYDIINGDGGIHGNWGRSPRGHSNTFGPFMMFRNTEKINTLFKRTYRPLKEILLHPKYQDFDEWPKRPTRSVEKPKHMETIIRKYQKELGIRSFTTTAPSMNDMPHCKLNFDRDKGKGCGICNYNQGVLTLNETGRIRAPNELFMCHFQVGKKRGMEASLENTTMFELMLKTGKFQAGFDGKFRLLE